MIAHAQVVPGPTSEGEHPIRCFLEGTNGGILIAWFVPPSRAPKPEERKDNGSRINVIHSTQPSPSESDSVAQLPSR